MGLMIASLHFFTVKNVRWQALPGRFGHWNSVWKRFKRVALRCDKTERSYRSIVSIAASLCLIKLVHTGKIHSPRDVF
jgi:transposase